MAIGGNFGAHLGKGWKQQVGLIVAATKDSYGIGKNGQLPWKLAADMKYFKKVTTQTSDQNKKNAVIMGRKTWESIPSQFRPLLDRVNLVLSRNPSVREALHLPSEVMTANSLTDAIDQLKKIEEVENVFIIGGQTIYEEALQTKVCEKVFLTLIENKFDCDTFCRIPLNEFDLVSTSEVQNENGIQFSYQILQKKVAENNVRGLLKTPMAYHEEYQYLDLIRKIIDQGAKRVDRTGTGTLSIFGAQMRFSLRNNVFPLLTTKRVFWRGVAEELLWFVSGDTNAKSLQARNIHIWDGNGSREYLDSIGLTNREEGDLGPVYGFQWRHFGAKYLTMHDDYTGQGVDQLAEVIDKIKNNPTDRRIVLTAWNPTALKEMALPPCHMFCQFYVADEELSCQMYQRSADMGLGVPFNIASYALLTRLLAQVTGLKAGDFIHTIGDAHVYLNHVEPLREQLKREPRAFPILHIAPEKKNIDDFTYSDFSLEGYTPHNAIKMEMSV